MKKLIQWLKNLRPLPQGVQDLNPKGYLNPLCEVEVLGLKHKDGTPNVFKQPFIFMVHTYLKDYGWDPESQIDKKTPVVVFRMAAGSELHFPLYIKDRPEGGFAQRFTPDEIIKKGYLLPQARQPEGGKK